MEGKELIWREANARYRASTPSAVQLGVFESAGSRAVVIGRKLSYPRTGRPEGFTARCPHMDSGMGGLL